MIYTLERAQQVAAQMNQEQAHPPARVYATWDGYTVVRAYRHPWRDGAVLVEEAL